MRLRRAIAEALLLDKRDLVKGYGIALQHPMMLVLLRSEACFVGLSVWARAPGMLGRNITKALFADPRVSQKTPLVVRVAVFEVDALAGRVLIATIKASWCEVGAFVGKVLTVAVLA